MADGMVEHMDKLTVSSPKAPYIVPPPRNTSRTTPIPAHAVLQGAGSPKVNPTSNHALQPNASYLPPVRAPSGPSSNTASPQQQPQVAENTRHSGASSSQEVPQHYSASPQFQYADYYDPNTAYYPQEYYDDPYYHQQYYGAYAQGQYPAADGTYMQGAYPPYAGHPGMYPPTEGSSQQEWYGQPETYGPDADSYTSGGSSSVKQPQPAFPPPTPDNIAKFREQARQSNDPAVQLTFAKFLIDAITKVGNDDPDQKRARKIKEGMMLEAQKIIKKLATQGMGLGKPAYPEAQFYLANCFGSGRIGLAVDHDKAFNLYVQASKQNHPMATYRTAVCYEVGAGTKRDHARAVQFYRKAAALGDTAAMFKLGLILLNGLLGQNKNPREGITWLKRAAAVADAENPHALHELGLAYEKAGIPSIIPDEKYARELFTQAAQLGYAPSQFKLGCSYEYGLLTCPVDPRRSIAWYTRAAEQGDAESELALSGWYLTGSEGVLKQSDTEAYLWARKAADKGLAKAEYAVGYYSEVGIGTVQSLEEARRWYMRAAASGNKRAMQRLTELKKMGSRAVSARQKHTRTGGGGIKEDSDCKVM
ncbi:hypothetical protein BZG36_04125 [Bifiguratus adelaidae]|uniref:HCP-like protein n=1 Tax=Bifiguratus adelaidae TaxID=1938954 RepID=A0A261XXF2_9FUNG|nr:hypothetical protein BZG36_04125 [Bifiguratus adelaidae]